MGDSLFDEPKRFIEFPEHHSFVTAYGIDLAYSESTISDWSVILRGRRIGNDLYVIGCERKQIAATKFLPLMKRMYDQVHGVVRWYHGGGGELGMVSFIAREIQNFCGIAAKNDKVIRSANAQKAWNTGHVHLPSEESPFYGQWVKDMRSEVVTFSGAGDEHDDFVDALAALVDQMFGTSFDWDTADGMQDSITRAKARNTVNAGGWRRT
jgi:phage terminase large subunit-like protein